MEMNSGTAEFDFNDEGEDESPSTVTGTGAEIDEDDDLPPVEKLEEYDQKRKEFGAKGGGALGVLQREKWRVLGLDVEKMDNLAAWHRSPLIAAAKKKFGLRGPLTSLSLPEVTAAVMRGPVQRVKLGRPKGSSTKRKEHPRVIQQEGHHMRAKMLYAWGLFGLKASEMDKLKSHQRVSRVLQRAKELGVVPENTRVNNVSMGELVARMEKYKEKGTTKKVSHHKKPQPAPQPQPIVVEEIQPQNSAPEGDLEFLKQSEWVVGYAVGHCEHWIAVLAEQEGCPLSKAELTERVASVLLSTAGR